MKVTKTIHVSSLGWRRSCHGHSKHIHHELQPVTKGGSRLVKSFRAMKNVQTQFTPVCLLVASAWSSPPVFVWVRERQSARLQSLSVSPPLLLTSWQMVSTPGCWWSRPHELRYYCLTFVVLRLFFLSDHLQHTFLIYLFLLLYITCVSNFVRWKEVRGVMTDELMGEMTSYLLNVCYSTLLIRLV